MKREIRLVLGFIFLNALSSVAMAQTPSPAPSPVLLPTYKSIREVVFASKCIACHSPGQHAEALPLQDYDLMMAEGELAVPGNLSQSLIVAVIEEGSMPPRRSGIPQVTALELATIKTWIVNGAPKE